MPNGRRNPTKTIIKGIVSGFHINIVKFKTIFNGLESAYGTYTIESEREDTKQVGKGFVVREVPTDIIWQKHLDGKEPSLGIIPIRSDQTCVWGAFDIDEYKNLNNMRNENISGITHIKNLYINTGFGSNGFTTSPLASEIIISYIEGTPMPISEPIRRAISPNRFLYREQKRK